jgi:hypothetical protein
MKIYEIFPVTEAAESDPACAALVARLVFESLRSGGDLFQYAIDWSDRTDAEGPIISRFEADEQLLLWLEEAIASGSPVRPLIRSFASCRAATFGYDQQAILCLRHEDAAPVSPDSSLVVVEERPEILAEYDYFDGWLPVDDLLAD